MDGSTLGTTIVPTGQNTVSIIVDEVEDQIYVVNNEESGTVTVIDGAFKCDHYVNFGILPRVFGA
jgi:DNA-binding beta-propeller fold protein YncE